MVCRGMWEWAGEPHSPSCCHHSSQPCLVHRCPVQRAAFCSRSGTTKWPTTVPPPWQRTIKPDATLRPLIEALVFKGLAFTRNFPDTFACCEILTPSRVAGMGLKEAAALLAGLLALWSECSQPSSCSSAVRWVSCKRLEAQMSPFDPTLHF